MVNCAKTIVNIGELPLLNGNKKVEEGNKEVIFAISNSCTVSAWCLFVKLVINETVCHTCSVDWLMLNPGIDSSLSSVPPV